MKPIFPKHGSSTRLLRKGILIRETYQIMAEWDLSASIRENFQRVKDTNPIGAANSAWLREVTATLSSRFRTPEVIEPLVFLAKKGLPLSEWRWFLLWRTQTTDLLFSRFVTDWLFSQFELGVHNIRAEHAAPVFRDLMSEVAGERKAVSEYAVVRGGRDLLRMAADLGLVEGKASKNFTPAHVPEIPFLWALHDLYSTMPNAYNVIHDPCWRLFLLSREDVEREIFDLHQFQKLDFQAAGSLMQLKLPHPDAMTYLRSIYP